MGKKNKANALGRSLIKDKMVSSRGKRCSDSVLHTAELNDGNEWTCHNLQSVTEETSLQEFLSTAELAGTEFQAERLNIKFVNPNCGVGLLSQGDKDKILAIQNEKKSLLKIPRRPHWNSDMSAEELHSVERESFLEWRRNLAKLQEDDGLLMTPYEKNLDFWRQLWRVVERSDIVVQILDARNPLLFRCSDLEKYVKEVDKQKQNVLLMNKSDFLTESQRKAWAEYFDGEGIRVAFFSAKNEGPDSTLTKIIEDIEEDIDDSDLKKDTKNKIDKKNESQDEEDLNNNDDGNYETESEEEINETVANKLVIEDKNSSELLNRESLIELFKQMKPKLETEQRMVVVGLVGYPNVGKSSTINALINDKKTSVSSTPGKTKHFQTLFIDSELMLCDCPGLVMPSFVYTKADLVINGILPIDQMRDHVPPINLVCSIFPRYVLEDKYSIMIPKPIEGEDENRSPTDEELLNAYGFSRGFMTQNGQPDNPRSSRYILKDYVNGQLLYCHAPPNVSQDEYFIFPTRKRDAPLPISRQAQLAVKPMKVTGESIDKQFFKQINMGYHTKGSVCVKNSATIGNRSISGSTLSINSTDSETINSKPWKNHKEKRNKREKLRRVYRYLDE